jgi:hypothetical protein
LSQLDLLLTPSARILSPSTEQKVRAMADDDELIKKEMRLKELLEKEVVILNLKKIIDQWPDPSGERKEIWNAWMDELVTHPVYLTTSQLLALKMWFDETFEELPKQGETGAVT